MALISCIECGKQISSAAPACLHCGLPQSISAPAPVMGSACPKCISPVAAKARVCPHCSFDLEGYRENLAQAVLVDLQRAETNEETKAAALAQVYSQNSGCAGIVVLVIGCASLVIPIAGLIIAPVMVTMALIVIVSPVRGGMWLDRCFKPEEYTKNQASALELLNNSYPIADCPACKCQHKDLCFPDAGGFFDCPSCGKRSFRQGHQLIYLPNPDAVLSANYRELIDEQRRQKEERASG